MLDVLLGNHLRAYIDFVLVEELVVEVDDQLAVGLLLIKISRGLCMGGNGQKRHGEKSERT